MDKITTNQIRPHLSGKIASMQKSILDDISNTVKNKLIEKSKESQVNVTNSKVSTTYNWSRMQMGFVINSDVAEEYGIYTEEDLGEKINDALNDCIKEL